MPPKKESCPQLNIRPQILTALVSKVSDKEHNNDTDKSLSHAKKSCRHKEHLGQYLDAHRARGGKSMGARPKQPGSRIVEDQKSTSKNQSRTGTSQSQDRNQSADSIPVLFTSSTRSRASYLASRAHTRPVRITGDAKINWLPDELMLEIFSYLGAGDLLNCGQVCHRWKILANDSLLWSKVFEKFGISDHGHNSAERLSTSEHRAMCIKHCKTKRNKKVLPLLKKLSPFTGLPRDTEKALKVAGVYFQLCFISKDDRETILCSRDVFHHQMSTSVRWYDLQMPSLQHTRTLTVHAVTPLFFDKDGKALYNSPYQRSFLSSIDLDWSKWCKINRPIAADDMINLYSWSNGLLIATWKGDGELAFVCQGLHNNDLVRRCLNGTSTQCYDPGPHKPIPDDVDRTYGLHDYQCTVEIRTLRQGIWSQQFKHLSCKKDAIGSSYAPFPLIRRDSPCDHVILQKKLNFPWKTETFKGIVENVVWLDVLVRDERNEPFWCVSSAVAINRKMLEENLSFDYTNQDVFVVTYREERGTIEANMCLNADKEYFITSLELKLSLQSINEWFATNYQ